MNCRVSRPSHLTLTINRRRWVRRWNCPTLRCPGYSRVPIACLYKAGAASCSHPDCGLCSSWLRAAGGAFSLQIMARFDFAALITDRPRGCDRRRGMAAG